jgi:hypothetical protein
MNRLITAAVMLAASVDPGCLFAAAKGQPLAAVRGRVLVRMGTTVSRDYHLFPLATGTGKVFAQPIHEEGASSVKIHFVLAGASQNPWRVVVTDGSNQWQHEGPSAFPGDDVEFWSDEIPSEDVIVEVYATQPGSGLKLTIDKIARGEVPATPQSITGRNDLASILGQEAWIVALGKSVALLRFVADDGNEYACTGFLVSPNLLLTNQHCINSESEARSATAVFDFDSLTSKVATVRVKALEFSNHDLDYSFVRLETTVPRTAIRLQVAPPVEKENLLMIEHPGGEPKQVSIIDCRVKGTRVIGRSAMSDCPDKGGAELFTDFGHECDTKPGSSGSPVFDFKAREVIGLHHLGFCPGGNLFNKAVSVKLILGDLKRNRPGLFGELSVATEVVVQAGK